MAITFHYPEEDQEVYANKPFCVWGAKADNEFITEAKIIGTDVNGDSINQVLNQSISTSTSYWGYYCPAIDPKPREDPVDSGKYPVTLRISYRVGMVVQDPANVIFNYREHAFTPPPCQGKK